MQATQNDTLPTTPSEKVELHSVFDRQVMQSEKVLDMGCGRFPLRGENVVTVDRDPRFCPTVVHDLSVFPYPFEDNAFDYIHCAQIIEHLPDTIGVMREILRIAKPGARVSIGVPHFSSAIAYRDPTHVSFFSVKTMDYFTGDYFPLSALPHNKRFEVLSTRVSFSTLWRLLGLASLFNVFQRIWEDKLHGIFPAKYILWDLVVHEMPDSAEKPPSRQVA